MDKPMPNIAFKGMALVFKLRDLLSPRRQILQEADVKPGFRVLDFGCGPGGYLLDTVALVGPSGMVYALDVHPLAIQSVQRIAGKKGLTNVETILSDCKTGLPDNSINVVLLYDILHMLNDPNGVLAELHRVLKQDGVLSCLDPHMNQDEAIASVTATRLFRLSKRGKKTWTFAKQT
jgi:ubiquinone/menaquinone biosynthesis C-methylase UbiE